MMRPKPTFLETMGAFFLVAATAWGIFALCTVYGESALPTAQAESSKPPLPEPTLAVKVEGPTEVRSGQMAMFKLVGLEAKYVPHFDWKIFGPPGATLADLTDRKTGAPVLVFQAYTPGRYAIIADVNREPLSDCRLVIHEFDVGSSPPPPPPPDTDIAKQVLAWSKQVQGAMAKIEAAKLAVAYRKIAADIAARKIVRRDAVPGAVAKANPAALGARGSAWRGFFTRYAATLDKWEGQDRKISEIARVLIETAEGWEAM